MTLIKSISGIRGTIGGQPQESLTPLDIVKFTSSYCKFIQNRSNKKRVKIILGRDARISGKMVRDIVCGTLVGYGADVIDLGMTTTPTVEVAVTELGADGGVVLTASHNPREWNALKLLNEKGEFISAQDGEWILNFAELEEFEFAEVDDLGTISETSFDKRHIEMVLALPLVDLEAIKQRRFKVVVDAVNSVGGTIIPTMLRQMGVEVVELYCTPDGEFPHNPEPLPEHLTEISKVVVAEQADLGFVVDPDVDRLAIVNEDGTMFGEEYTLVAVADYVLSQTKGNSCSNLSSTRALADITERHGGKYMAAAVGEVNVVKMMKEIGAVIGGEGNGGIIYPELHYGRDALVGIALFLSLMAQDNRSCSELRSDYPEYYMSKNKIELTPEIDIELILNQMKQRYSAEKITDIDGLKIDFTAEWVHMRKSNTEPIIRIYSESRNKKGAQQLAEKIIQEIRELI